MVLCSCKVNYIQYVQVRCYCVTTCEARFPASNAALRSTRKRQGSRLCSSDKNSLKCSAQLAAVSSTFSSGDVFAAAANRQRECKTVWIVRRTCRRTMVDAPSAVVRADVGSAEVAL